MNLTRKLAGVVLLFGLLGIYKGNAQTQINPKLGFENWSIKDKKVQSGRSSHSGQTNGFDVYYSAQQTAFHPRLSLP